MKKACIDSAEPKFRENKKSQPDPFGKKQVNNNFEVRNSLLKAGAEPLPRAYKHYLQKYTCKFCKLHIAREYVIHTLFHSTIQA